jgi:VCBS repeat-containing protein
VTAPGVLGNDSDADSEPLTAVLGSGPSHGTLVLNADGSFTYAPAPDFHGTDTFTYKANDGITDSNVTTVTITVKPINDAPVAEDDAYETDEDVPLSVAAPGVLDNDSDVDGDLLTAVPDSGPSHGTLVLIADGSFTYAPDPDFYGTDTFTYQANDGTTDSNVATVTITVYQGNQSPDCSGATSEPGVIWPPDKDFWPVSVLDVTDPDDDPITITITSIFQDELVGKGKSSPDGKGVGTSTAEVRAERDGNGDGRVYHIYFTADDGRGGTCEGEVRTAIVTHDQSGDLDAIDGGPLYDSTQSD